MPEIDWQPYTKLVHSDPRRRAWKYIFLFGTGNAPPPMTGTAAKINKDAETLRRMEEEVERQTSSREPIVHTASISKPTSLGTREKPGGKM